MVRFSACICFLLSGAAAFAQCTNNNVLAGVAVTPACPGTTNVPCVQGGQYALINVVSGNTYTFSTCAASFDTQITLFNNAGGGALGFNDDACGGLGLQSSVTWTASFTGQLRVLVDLYNCATNATCAPLSIACSTPPAGDCVYTLTLFDSFSDGWGTSNVGVSINGGPFQYYTVPPGVPSNFVQFGVNIGSTIVLTYNASGAWQTDNSYILTLGGSTLFNSGSPPLAGTVYASTVTCVPPPPPPEDCLGAVTICSNVSLSNNTNNTGNVADINPTNSGCLDVVEFQGTWYVFSPSAGGNLGFTINPLGPDDYDWAVWGPYPPGTVPSMICPPVGPPIRCAASSGPATFASTGSYATGMGHATYSPPQFASTAVSYGIPATLDACPLVPPQSCGWVPGMNVTVGQVYLMYISNWSQSSTGFSLNWTLANGASLDCTILPVDLLEFSATAAKGHVHLDWSTGSESGSDRFLVERSRDGQRFDAIAEVDAAGHSVQVTRYGHVDEAPLPGMSYYRLRQLDQDGAQSLSPVRSVLIDHAGPSALLIPNPGAAHVEVLVLGFGDGSFVLLDASGREVLKERVTEGRAAFGAQALPRGLYGYRLLDTQGLPRAHGTWVRE